MSDYHDSVTNKRVSETDRSIIQNTRNAALASRQTAEASKQIALNSQITNDELKKLNSTTTEIAAANAALVAIQSDALNESTKQTALLDAQLQIAKINELEKNRQTLIKQAAFSVEQKVEEILKIAAPVSQYFYLRDQLNQVEIVQLSADSPNEIADKKYVKEVLNKLNDSFSDAKSKLNPKQISDVDSYYENINKLAIAKFDLQDVLAEIDGFKLSRAPSKALSGLFAFFHLKFFESKKVNLVVNILYYFLLAFLLALTLTAISQSGVSGLGILIFDAIFLVPIVYFNYRKNVKKSLSEYDNQKSNLDSLINRKNVNVIEVEKLESFFRDFRREYSIN